MQTNHECFKILIIIHLGCSEADEFQQAHDPARQKWDQKVKSAHPYSDSTFEITLVLGVAPLTVLQYQPALSENNITKITTLKFSFEKTFILIKKRLSILLESVRRH